MPAMNSLVSPNSFLDSKRDTNGTYGAFWTSGLKLPSFEDISFCIAEFHSKEWPTQRSFNPTRIREQLEREQELAHIGFMIGEISDSKVPHLDSRLREVQILAKNHRNAIRQQKRGLSGVFAVRKVWDEARDKSLQLGLDICSARRETLREIREFGTPIRGIVLPSSTDPASKRLAILLKKNSLHYPSQWNSKIVSNLKVEYLWGRDDCSSYDPSVDKFEIVSGKDGSVAFGSGIEIANAKALDSLDYHTKHEFIHELGHMYESNSDSINAIANTFLERRRDVYATTSKKKPLFVENSFVSTYLDHFPMRVIGDSYVDGKNPDERNPFSPAFMKQFPNTEVFARGVEATLWGTAGSLSGIARYGDSHYAIQTSYTPDIELRNLILGKIAAVDL